MQERSAPRSAESSCLFPGKLPLIISRYRENSSLKFYNNLFHLLFRIELDLAKRLSMDTFYIHYLSIAKIKELFENTPVKYLFDFPVQAIKQIKIMSAS